MEFFNWADCYAYVLEWLRKQGYSRPIFELVCRMAALMFCEQYRDYKKSCNEEIAEDDLTIVDAKLEEVDASTIALVRVRYRGRVIVLVFDTKGFVRCYLDGEPKSTFLTVQEAMDAIDYELDSKLEP
ncbi:hypothetical protein [uncultured Sneathiella sp.]|uniref:hypothetical protein n=1 Tax=uncultured Sneathiella sp. TaxID=879315 RepID=UPI0030ED4FD2|tara:strand:+ start:1596 stop:1979 length:384 start_codon:yes stop_codon:yes gene_type:complete